MTIDQASITRAIAVFGEHAQAARQLRDASDNFALRSFYNGRAEAFTAAAKMLDELQSVTISPPQNSEPESGQPT
jgi:hypothetical protein